VLVGAAGDVMLAGDKLSITGLTGRPGEVAPCHVRIPHPQSVTSVTVNGIPQPFTRTSDEICLAPQFAGERHVRELDNWTQSDGKRFEFPSHPDQAELRLETTFKLSAAVRQLLTNAKPKNFGAMDSKIADWQTNRAASYAYHNFVCERPPRYRQNAGPKVTTAKMMATVTLREAAELRVELDLPPDQIKRVMFFESGFGWMGQHPLVFNKEAQCWTAMMAPGSRAMIQENDFVYVWAEGKDGLRSEYYPVKVGWDFTSQSRNPK
jgi:hypothetical protein